MNNEDEQIAFSEWFDDLWLGDLEHDQHIPTIHDSGYGGYLEARQLAQGAWMHRAQIASTNVSVEKSWQRFEAKMSELEREKSIDAAPTPPEQHSDDVAVDRFAAAMKVKLAQKRAEGRGGWDDPEQCPVERLAELLHEHVSKGDPIDVANFSMMLWCRGGRTTPPVQQCRDDGRCQYAIDHGAEGIGHCLPGKCVMPVQQDDEALEMLREMVAAWDSNGKLREFVDSVGRARALLKKRGAA